MSRTLYLSRMRRLLTREGASFRAALRARRGWRPREVEIRLTWACNAACEMCGLHWYLERCDPAYTKPLPRQRLLDLLGELAGMGTESILFSGGEVTLLADLPKIIRRSSELGIEAHINTNGSRLSEEYCDRLLEAGLRGVMLSLDAPTAEMHDAIRGLPGVFHAAVAGMSHLRRCRPKQSELYLLINTVIMKRNYLLMPDLVDLAADIGVSEVSFSPLSIDNPWDDWATGRTELKLTPSDEARLKREVFPRVLQRAKARNVTAMIPAEVLPDGAAEVARNLFRERPVTCAVTHYHSVINVNGDVIPCCYASASEYGMGNVARTPFIEIWNNEAYRDFRRGCFPARFEMCRSCAQHRHENELIERWFLRDEPG